MIYTIIVAVDQKGGISKQGEIPWHYREDFEWFKEKTIGHPCIMGRGTFEDIKRRSKSNDILPGRISWVVTSQATTYDPGVPLVGTLLHPKDIENYVHTVRDFVKYPHEVMVLGGLGVYLDVLRVAQIIHLTCIKKDFECDQIFPLDYVYQNFDLAYSEEGINPDLTFNTYIRKTGP